MIALARSVCLALTLALTAAAAQAADRARLETFLEVTGFDVALDSIRLSASSAPAMLGLEAEDFGAQWTVMADDVFNTAKMHDMALDILGATLEDDLLDHATEFYDTDLGRRLVVAENNSHMEDDSETKSEAGQAIVAGLERIGSPRLDALKRMNAASDSAGTAVRAIQEVQVRFLMAAAAAGVIELKMEEPDLREAMRADEDELRQSIAESALSGAAYTYQAFSDAEVLEYAKALEDPDMRKVYDLMNAVQYEIMANRYEALAARMRNLQPSQEL
ncbi:DUF2059 domain-containing protein [Pseudosulfitobacter pseudonitzschiae]|uniref:DUF2059 domain-containing protein n=1 Tax=Pseudosulfitobacter pseudonitzschiae TaxID=1402135 RepID=UPI001AF0ED0B|nr:DUF2059 domain-containing protein [Pseudosulfitobacter pseudonitzschiae]MBM1814749.1 DUF2059 domain-containing protein [Pseudosulfitobacter pseudonitzschiae]MBM1831743.1 DUF2059 domain-containing protein [Pseudosulfitobacter pseudonitzschiae]MBM1836608.1 DUF2059 domain-containing protein [Pseudosulfitobacter pseudonitzschiae]MBM1841455.1 DUF2059 domain-containing protein [Pseudosulfitobacter pseudonitzschiae]MBM1846322.1 DUF2059 domain-containing protein [Pseudosulfitobacter pseudonitzschia